MCEIQVKGPFNRYVTNAMGGGGGCGGYTDQRILALRRCTVQRY